MVLYMKLSVFDFDCGSGLFERDCMRKKVVGWWDVSWGCRDVVLLVCWKLWRVFVWIVKGMVGKEVDLERVYGVVCRLLGEWVVGWVVWWMVVIVFIVRVVCWEVILVDVWWRIVRSYGGWWMIMFCDVCEFNWCEV